jgi:hemoglobin
MRKALLIMSLWLATALIGPARADAALYGSLGERPGIQRIVDALALLWLDDARIKDDFDNINMDHLKLRLVDQLCQVSGGPCHYKGRPMGPSHKGLHINQAKFDAVVEDLQTAMDQVGIPFRVQNRLIARLAPMERDIVTR